MKKNRKKGLIIAAAVLVVIAAAAFFGMKSMAGNSAAPTVETTPLAKGNLRRTVSASGLIESTSTENVNNSSGMTVWEINVGLGEFVESGTQLCSLHTAAIDGQGEQWAYVTAPVAGTVTAINIKNGDLAGGVLFTIENTSSLRVVANVKEADLGSVQPGQVVEITTDATGDRVYTGTLESIAPTAKKSAGATGTEGSGTATATNPEFPVTIRLDSEIGGLLIGMKTECTIVAEEHQDVYNVDYTALTKDNNGNNQLFVATDPQDGVYTVKALPVTTGLESDFAIEISGDGLSDGLAIINNPSAVSEGQQVRLQDDAGTDQTK